MLLANQRQLEFFVPDSSKIYFLLIPATVVVALFSQMLGAFLQSLRAFKQANVFSLAGSSLGAVIFALCYIFNVSGEATLKVFFGASIIFNAIWNIAFSKILFKCLK